MLRRLWFITQTSANLKNVGFFIHFITPCFHYNNSGIWRVKKNVKIIKTWFGITVDVEVFGWSVEVAEAVVTREVVVAEVVSILCVLVEVAEAVVAVEVEVVEVGTVLGALVEVVEAVVVGEVAVVEVVTVLGVLVVVVVVVVAFVVVAVVVVVACWQL